MAEADGDNRVDPLALKRLREMLDFIETLNRWYQQMIGVPKSQLVALIKLGAKVTKLLSMTRKTAGREAADAG